MAPTKKCANVAGTSWYNSLVSFVPVSSERLGSRGRSDDKNEDNNDNDDNNKNDENDETTTRTTTTTKRTTTTTQPWGAQVQGKENREEGGGVESEDGGADTSRPTGRGR